MNEEEQVHYEVRANTPEGTRFLAPGGLFTAYRKAEFETESEAFEALGRWVHSMRGGFKSWTVSVLKITQMPRPEPQVQRVKGIC